MSISVSLQKPTGFGVRDFTKNNGRSSFVTVQVTTGDDDTVDIFLDNTDDCDRLIAAACKAKRLLSPPGTGDYHPSRWIPAATAPCYAVSDAGECTSQHYPHPLPHRAANGYEWDEPDGDDANAPHHAADDEPYWQAAETQPEELCPDCGRASCTGEDCYWPDEAGIARPESDGTPVIVEDEPQPPQCADGRLTEDSGTIAHCRLREGHEPPHRDARGFEWTAADNVHVPNVHPRLWPYDGEADEPGPCQHCDGEGCSACDPTAAEAAIRAAAHPRHPESYIAQIMTTLAGPAEAGRP